jgi:hypothetical protein
VTAGEPLGVRVVVAALTTGEERLLGQQQVIHLAGERDAVAGSQPGLQSGPVHLVRQLDDVFVPARGRVWRHRLDSDRSQVTQRVVVPGRDPGALGRAVGEHADLG